MPRLPPAACRWAGRRAGGSLREPGGTPAGEAIRDVLLHRARASLPGPRHCSTRRRAPSWSRSRAALARGRHVVVLDRYVDSSLAYQGPPAAWASSRASPLNERATGGLLPDLTLLLEVSPERAAARAGGPPDRIEAEGLDVSAARGGGYAELAPAAIRERIVALDGERPPDAGRRAARRRERADLRPSLGAIAEAVVSARGRSGVR